MVARLKKVIAKKTNTETRREGIFNQQTGALQMGSLHARAHHRHPKAAGEAAPSCSCSQSKHWLPEGSERKKSVFWGWGAKHSIICQCVDPSTATHPPLCEGGAAIDSETENPTGKNGSKLQGDVERKTYGSMTQTYRAIYAEGGGVRAFFRGGLVRCGLVSAAVFTLDKSRSEVAYLLYGGSRT
eukprot:NODE_3084_length_820_cov_21.190661_g2563_i0.p1 GENE.NODE_3084_length_820_cov_21.190661_g2563_i0~~NODE_3084_length_820_cov_21.190661_g2563_i0.p1  ORF type:complete len:185 (-),score=12.95 NODE_3084_length_820_cov_21.190661_g2563_i0:54-608(-)